MPESMFSKEPLIVYLEQPEPKRDSKWWAAFTTIAFAILALLFGFAMMISYFIMGGSTEMADRILGGCAIGLFTALLGVCVAGVWWMEKDL
jgi:hypothetical protein